MQTGGGAISRRLPSLTTHGITLVLLIGLVDDDWMIGWLWSRFTSVFGTKKILIAGECAF